MTNWVATMPSSVRDGDRYRTHNLAIQRDGSVWSLEEPNIRGKKRILPRRKRPKRIGFILTADQIPGG